MKNLFFSVIVGVPVLVWAADALVQLGWEREPFERAFVECLASENYLPLPRVPSGVKLLPVGQRKAAVEALGAQAKAYYASEAFRKRWIERHGGHYKDPNEAKRKADEAAATKKAKGQAKAQMDQMEQAIAMMPPEMQAQARQQIAQAKSQMEKEEARKAAKGGGTDEAGAPVPDAKAALKRALERFLKLSEGIDFAASTTKQGAQTRFVNPAFESKPEGWKACFRAGKDATEAARAFAKGWLAELK